MSPIAKLMNQVFFEIKPGASILDAARMMDEKIVGLLLVRDGEKLEGVISERDIIKKIVAKNKSHEGLLVKDYMTDKVITVEIDLEVVEAWKIMKSNNFRHLVVVDPAGQLPVGVVSIKDILEYLALDHEVSKILEGLEHRLD
ncbi:MAG: CBS domain-containing protein [Halobacteriovoraceae bacterium]|nr:CBS domain-containing protein [Halobacteriovoraceae bacterium]